jgi:predicted nucleotidyltransferase
VRDSGRVTHDPALDDAALADVARRLTAVPGVVGVTLGGSRARGEHSPESDVDLGLYYVPPLDTAGLQLLARDLAGPAARVTRPGDWGPWVDGGAWLRVDGVAVDWIYRDLHRVTAVWQGARAGRCRWHAQVGHPLGFLDAAYAGELALGVVLADPTGAVGSLHRETAVYPPALGDALVAGLAEADFLLGVAAKATGRGDTAYVGGCLFRIVGLCAHALHGSARRWLVNEKGAVAAAGRLPRAPAGFAERAHAVLATLGRSPAELAAALAAARDLVAAVTAACR